MEKGDFFYAIFWSFAMAFAAYFLGFGPVAAVFFAMALVGCAAVEKIGNAAYVAGAALVALAFASYFSSSFYFLTDRVAVGMLMFFVLPAALLEVRKFTGRGAEKTRVAQPTQSK